VTRRRALSAAAPSTDRYSDDIVGPVKANGRLLDLPTIFEAGLRLVDSDGLNGLTIRRLADSLGVGAMTMYRYVNTKDEIIQGVWELAFGRYLESLSWEGHWAEQLRRAARRLLVLFAEHPGILHLFLAQPIRGPRTEDWSIHMFSALEGANLNGEAAVYAFTTVHSYVMGFALLRVARSGRPGVTLPGAEWALNAETARAMGSRTSDDAFEYGLNHIIDSLAASDQPNHVP
jgi:AcrR family transcriptional regulator